MKLTEEDLEERLYGNNEDVGIFIDCDDKEYTISELKTQILENQRLRELVEEKITLVKDVKKNPQYYNISYCDPDILLWEFQSLLDKSKLNT